MSKSTKATIKRALRAGVLPTLLPDQSTPPGTSIEPRRPSDEAIVEQLDAGCIALERCQNQLAWLASLLRLIVNARDLCPERAADIAEIGRPYAESGADAARYRAAQFADFIGDFQAAVAAKGAA